MSFDPHNLVAHTVQGHRGAEVQAERRKRCRIWRPMKYPPFFRPNAKTNYHEWTTAGKLQPRCRWCGKTVREIMIKIKPQWVNDGSMGALQAAIESGR